MLKAPIFWSRSGRLSQLVGHDIGHLAPVATRGFVGELGVKIPKWNRIWESVGFICVFFGFGIWGNSGKNLFGELFENFANRHGFKVARAGKKKSSSIVCYSEFTVYGPGSYSII